MWHTQVQPTAGFREPAARDDPTADPVGRLSIKVCFPILTRHDQGNLRGEIEINHLSPLSAPQDGAFDKAKPGIGCREILGRFWPVAGFTPDTSTRRASLIFCFEQDVQLFDVRRDSYGPGEPFPEQDFFDVSTLRETGMGQPPAIMIPLLMLVGKSNMLAFYQPGKSVTRLLCQRLPGHTVLA